MKDPKFYICEHCGNIVEVVHDAGVPVMCCGQKMTLLVPSTVEASVEKHLPVAAVEGNTVRVTVGSVEHPMTEAHHIAWIYLQTTAGGQRKDLTPDAAPAASFVLAEGEMPVAVFAYCNLHGLWKTEL